MVIPEKHRATLHAFIDGAELQIKGAHSDQWFKFCGSEIPYLCESAELRIKPKPKVKKWRWVKGHPCGHIYVADGFLTEKEAYDNICLEKIEASMIEVDE